MSLNVPTALLERAETGQVDDAEFVDCVRQSLPYAWSVVSTAAQRLTADPAAELPPVRSIARSPRVCFADMSDVLRQP